jgi:hypothetical protein
MLTKAKYPFFDDDMLREIVITQISKLLRVDSIMLINGDVERCAGVFV